MSHGKSVPIGSKRFAKYSAGHRFNIENSAEKRNKE